MPINKNIFLHEADKAALDALKSIPGFTQLVKSYMKSFNEKLFYIQNMSTNIHINENQLKKYHDMLIPICEKLSIDVPDLFLQLSPYPNAYTSGDSKPFIVITSGLIESLPERLIPTVLAHECGHIACQHVLYRTMGQMILNGAIASLLGQGVATLLTYPLRAAFYYWMRCSEFSADRAAILCDGSSDNMIEVCARLAGFSKNINEEINMDAFMKQAKEYRDSINESSTNKTMEYMTFAFSTHPINAVRAYEAKDWCDSENFLKAKTYFDNYRNSDDYKEIQINFNDRTFLAKDYKEVKKKLEDMGFNVSLNRLSNKNILLKNDTVTKVSINGDSRFNEDDFYPINSEVEIEYYSPLNKQELQSLHPGQIMLENSSSYYIGKNYKEVEMQLFEMGVANTKTEIVKDLKNKNDRRLNNVSRVLVNDKRFNKGDWIDLMDEITIYYHGLLEE